MPQLSHPTRSSLIDYEGWTRDDAPDVGAFEWAETDNDIEPEPGADSEPDTPNGEFLDGECGCRSTGGGVGGALLFVPLLLLWRSRPRRV